MNSSLSFNANEIAVVQVADKLNKLKAEGKADKTVLEELEITLEDLSY